MTTQTSAPIGNTGQSLEGVAVSTAAGANLFRESVVIADPNDPIGYSQVVSNQPSSSATPYGAVVWVAGTPNISSTVNVTVAQTSTQIISSIPFYVAQSSAPWDVRGGVQVSTIGTVSTQVISSIPIIVSQSTTPWDVRGGVNVSTIGTVSTQIVSSVPLIVSQSTTPWDVRGGVNVTAASAVVSSWPLNTSLVNIVSSIPQFVAQSSGPWDVRGGINVTAASAVVSTWPLNTTQVNIVTSIPILVAQSTSPWRNVVSSASSGGANSTTWVLVNNLNTTVIKNAAATLYGVSLSSIGSTNCFVRFYAASAAANVIASTAVPLWTIGVGPTSASNPSIETDVSMGVPGIAFSTGITVIAQQQPWTATNSIAPAGSSFTLSVSYF